MGGGLLQLVAYGPQDIYLTGNPQVTFFKVVYRRHTNFSIECIQQQLDSEVTTTTSCQRKCIVSRGGDLIYDAHLDVLLNAGDVSSPGTAWTWDTGHAYINEVELKIGGQSIDIHNGQWMDIKTSLYDHYSRKKAILNREGTNTDTPADDLNGAEGQLQLYIPLEFWFCRNAGLALPLIALQYHEVEFNFKFRGIYGLINTTASTDITGSPSITTNFYIDYVYLDTDERRRFAQVSHEYLIEQVQYQSNLIADRNEINFRHPVKTLIWICQDKEADVENTISSSFQAKRFTDKGVLITGGGAETNIKNNYFNYHENHRAGLSHSDFIKADADTTHCFSNAHLELSGKERFQKRKNSYFSYYQNMLAKHNVYTEQIHHIYTYSFALKPEEHQPSGTCNFSRLKNQQLIFEGVQAGSKTTINLKVFAVNYNILRIMSGMGGLAYN